ncbi:hypothetical protein ACFQX7_31270 [Luedemannella flava]
MCPHGLLDAGAARQRRGERGRVDRDPDVGQAVAGAQAAVPGPLPGQPAVPVVATEVAHHLLGPELEAFEGRPSRSTAARARCASAGSSISMTLRFMSRITSCASRRCSTS